MDNPDGTRPPGSKPVFGVAVRLLAGKRLTKMQLGKKLRDRGFAPDAIKETLAECERRGYLDDRTFAQLYVKSILERKPVGPLKLLSDLIRQGVDQNVAREVLDEIGDEEDDRIQQALRKLEALRPGDRFDQLARRLRTMGYRTPAIARVLRERARDGTRLGALEDLA